MLDEPLRAYHTEPRGYPFRGLVADGVARALFDLVRLASHVVMIMPGELLLELSDEGGFVSEGQVAEGPARAG